jgi:hypothetical protein
VGGRFVALSPTLRQRIGAILSFDDARPAFRLLRIDRLAAATARTVVGDRTKPAK